MSKNILVVEDNRIAAKVTALLLSQLGCDVKVVECGKAALDFVKKQKVDLVFMDLGLPDINGDAVTRQIRSTIPSYDDVPIVALTAHASEENRTQCLENGFNDFLLKPLSPEKAQAMLEML